MAEGMVDMWRRVYVEVWLREGYCELRRNSFLFILFLAIVFLTDFACIKLIGWRVLEDTTAGRFV